MAAPAQDRATTHVVETIQNTLASGTDKSLEIAVQSVENAHRAMGKFAEEMAAKAGGKEVHADDLKGDDKKIHAALVKQVKGSSEALAAIIQVNMPGFREDAIDKAVSAIGTEAAGNAAAIATHERLAPAAKPALGALDKATFRGLPDDDKLSAMIARLQSGAPAPRHQEQDAVTVAAKTSPKGDGNLTRKSGRLEV